MEKPPMSSKHVTHLNELPSDILYEITSKITANQSSLKDKFNNANQIINLCKTNKRFNQVYFKNDKIWKELWLRDIDSNLDHYSKNKYLNILNKLKNKSMDDILLYASKYDYLELAKYALDRGARIIQEDYDESEDEWLREEDALTTAIENGHLRMVNYLWQKVDKAEVAPWYYLVKAAENGYIEIVDYFIELGADINSEFVRIVPITAQAGQLEMLKYLVSLGADIHAWNDQALAVALSNKHFKVADYLINNGLPLQPIHLIWAVRDKNLLAVKYLLQHGLDINAVVGNYSTTALEMAVRGKNTKIIKYLLENGADINLLPKNLRQRVTK